MTLDYSIALTFLYRWFVQLERIVSNQKSGLRLVMVSLQTHLPKVLLLEMVILSVTLTFTIDVLRLLTLCKKKGYNSFNQETLLREGLFLSKYFWRPVFYYALAH